MTDERKNEIWAMLDSQCQNIAKDVYLKGNPKTAWAMEQFFGSHNLTAKAEEKPKYRRGDAVVVYGQPAVVFNAHEHGYDVIFQGDYKLFNLPESHIEPYHPENGESDGESKTSQEKPLDVAKSVETSTKEDAYFAYRLDLAKEIAVAVIRSDRWDFKSCDPVEQANEIVKRLKETEE